MLFKWALSLSPWKENSSVMLPLTAIVWSSCRESLVCRQTLSWVVYIKRWAGAQGILLGMLDTGVIPHFAEAGTPCLALGHPTINHRTGIMPRYGIRTRFTDSEKVTYQLITKHCHREDPLKIQKRWPGWQEWGTASHHHHLYLRAQMRSRIHPQGNQTSVKRRLLRTSGKAF